MSVERPLHGGCACGRNEYIIEMPPNASERAQVIFDRGFGSGTIYPTSHAAPLSAWLRVPLTWYHSTTFSFFPDETHASIRRVYTPPNDSATKRHFCGYCGTLLSFWSERPREEKEYISLTLGSLTAGDLRDLGELGLLPGGKLEGVSPPPEEATEGKGQVERGEPVRVRQGLPWFEDMVEGSQLGRVRVRRGEEVKAGRRVEWEIVEWVDGDADEGGKAREGSPAKRKRGEGEGDKGQAESVDAD